MNLEDVIVSDEPHDRLTRLTVEMTKPLDEAANADVKAIVFLDTEEKAGIQLHGWDSNKEAIAALIVHLQALFASVGLEMELIAIPNSPAGLDDA